MKRYILTYGVTAGLIVISSMIIGIVMSGGEGVGASMAIGFLIMFIALSMIFVAIKKYRDQEQGGVIRFSRAFTLGLGIAAIAGVMYVVVWEIYLNFSDYAYIHDYAAKIIEAKQTAGASAEEMTKITESMEKMTTQYANPLFRLPMTFMEIFPVGALIALISAFFLRYPKKRQTAG